MTTYVHVTGKVTAPDADGTGIHAKVTFYPSAVGELLALDDRITLGPAVGETDSATGVLQGEGVRLPVVDGVLWRMQVEPLSNKRTPSNPRGVPNLRGGPYEIAADVDLKDLAPTEVVPTTPAAVTLAQTAATTATEQATIATDAAASVQREQASGVAGLTSAGKLYETRIPDRLSDTSLNAAIAERSPRPAGRVAPKSAPLRRGDFLGRSQRDRPAQPLASGKSCPRTWTSAAVYKSPAGALEQRSAPPRADPSKDDHQAGTSPLGVPIFSYTGQRTQLDFLVSPGSQ